ncbi:MAG: hypothetical protein AB1758_27305 [Candidatus Eremiobacterota bacterium]
MTHDPIEEIRKLRLQVESETIVTYKLIGDTADRLDRRIDKLAGRFDRLEVRFDGLHKQFDGLQKQFDGLQKQFEGLRTEFAGFRGDFKALTDTLSDGMRALQGRLRLADERFVTMLQAIENRMEGKDPPLGWDERLQALETRIAKLEAAEEGKPPAA